MWKVCLEPYFASVQVLHLLLCQIILCLNLHTRVLGVAVLVEGCAGVGAAVRPPHRRPPLEAGPGPRPRPVLELPEELGRREGLDTSFPETRRRQHNLHPYLGATLEISRL